MTQEEKAKAYDEAIKKAESLYKAAEPMSGCNVIIETLFPKLKESEDEEIRKAIKSVISYNVGGNKIYGFTKEKMIAWLEKQGDTDNKFIRMHETKPKDISEFLNRLTTVEQEFLWEHIAKIKEVWDLEKQGEQNLIKIPKFKSGDTIEFNGLGRNRYTIKDVCGTSHYINTNNARMDMSYTDENFELVEQNPTDKAEPKFKIGDKIQYSKGCGTIMTIEKIENGEYIFADNMGHTTIESGNLLWILMDGC